jgi:uncharacterized protein YjbI with pentapeptide repeats
MADSSKPSPPELKNLKPALPDVWDLAKLEASVNATSQRAVTQWLAYLSLWAYLFFTTLSITDRALILLTPVKLPLIGVELGLQAFFWSAPPLFLVFHLYLVRKITVLARDVGFYRAAIQRFVPSEEAREPLYRRLDAFFLTRLLGHAEQGNLLRLFDGMIALATVAVMPLALMLAFQLRFLAFHDEYVTMWHRVCLVADVGLLVLLARWLKAVLGDRVRLLPEARGQWLRGGMEMARDMAGPVMAAYVAFSLFVATFPGEIHDEFLSFPDQKPNFPWRALAPRDVDFVSDKNIDKVKWTIDLRGRDLRLANLKGADLRKAMAQGVDLREADLSESNLQGSDLSMANMSMTVFNGSNLIGSNLRKSNLSGAFMINSSMQLSDMSESNFTGAIFSGSSLQGADVSYSILKWADLVNVDLRFSNLSVSELSGSVMYGALIGRTLFTQFNENGADTQLDYVIGRKNIIYSRDNFISEEMVSEWIDDIPFGVNRKNRKKYIKEFLENYSGEEEKYKYYEFSSEDSWKSALNINETISIKDVAQFSAKFFCNDEKYINKSYDYRKNYDKFIESNNTNIWDNIESEIKISRCRKNK